MTVTWQSLELAGFGRYRDTVRIVFRDGLTVCTGGNETGKSTLAAGITAVIYGLQSSADPRAFSQGRYRNWFGPSRFEGTLEFRANGRQYRIRRNFDNHRVSLQVLTERGWQETAGGEHNPNARKVNAAYTQKIMEILGVGSRELFYGTFLAAQPLPSEEALLPDVARLLSGGTHYQDALQALAGQLKEITRHTGQLGVTAQDMRQDRALELLEREIGETEQAVAESGRLLSELQQASVALAEARQELSGYSGELAGKEKLLEGWQRWRTYRDRYTDALQRQTGLTQACGQAANFRERTEQTKNRLTVGYARFLQLPEETGDALLTLSRLAAEEKRLSEEVEEAARALEAATACITQAEKELDGYTDVRGRQSLPADCQMLQKLLAEERQIAGAAETARAGLRELQAGLAALPPLDTLGKSPAQSVADALASAAAIHSEWQNFRNDLDELNALGRKLNEKYALFEQAGGEQLALLANYEAARHAMEREAYLARENVKRLEQRRQESEQAQQAFERLYGDLAVLGSNGLQLVEEKLGLLQAQDKKHRAPLVVSAILAGLAAGFGTYLFFAAYLPAGISAVAATILTYALLFFFTKDDSLSALRRVNSLLGPYAAAGEAELGEIRLRLRQRSAEQARLTEVHAEPAEGSTPEEALKQRKAADDALARFAEQTGPFAAAFTDVPQAFACWRDCARRVAELQSRVERSARRFGVQAEEAALPGMNPEELAAPWPQLSRVLAAFGYSREVQTVEGLVAVLEKLEPSWWEDVLQQANRYEGIREEIAAEERKLRELTGESTETAGRLARLRREIGQLRESVAPFDENSDIAKLKLRLQACQETEDRLRAQRISREQAEHRAGELQRKRSALQDEKEEPARLAAPLLGEGESPLKLLEDWQNFRELKRLLEQGEKELAAVLGAHGVHSETELQAAAADAANRALGILQSWEALLQEFPGLPGTGQDDPAGLEEMYRQLAGRVAVLRENIATLTEAVRELEFRHARLQGQTPLNLAAAEDRLCTLRERRARLQREATALQTAYRELDGAIGTYSVSYRQELSKMAGQYFQQITGMISRRIVVEENFTIHINEDGRDFSVVQLSQGARDQFYIAMRLAIADLLSGEIHLPFLFDDPFVNWDEARLANMRDALRAVSQSRQVVLLSHDEKYAAWGERCTITTAGGEV